MDWRAALAEGGEPLRPPSAPSQRSPAPPTPKPSTSAPPRKDERGGSSATGTPSSTASAPARGNSALAMMRQAMETTAQEGAGGRLTDEQIRAERITSMRAKDPVLGAAIDMLDLELLD